MTVGRFFGKTGRRLAVAAAILAAVGLTTVPRPADAGGGGISPGAAVGIGLGAFALGSVLANPYLLQPVLLPLRLLPTHPGVLSAGGILSAHTELLERLLPLLLRLLSSGRAPPLSPPVRQRAADPRHPGGVPLLARASEGIKP